MSNFLWRTTATLLFCLCALAGTALAQQSSSQPERASSDRQPAGKVITLQSARELVPAEEEPKAAAEASRATTPSATSEKASSLVKRASADRGQEITLQLASKVVPNEDKEAKVAEASGTPTPPKASEKKVSGKLKIKLKEPSQ